MPAPYGSKTPSGLPKKPEKRIFRKSLGTVGFPKHRSSVFTRSGPSAESGRPSYKLGNPIDDAYCQWKTRIGIGCAIRGSIRRGHCFQDMIGIRKKQEPCGWC